MKWFGLGITSAIMGVFLAVMAETAFPALTQEGFAAAAVIGGIVIFSIMLRLTLAAGTIEIRPANEWDARKLQ